MLVPVHLGPDTQGSGGAQATGVQMPENLFATIDRTSTGTTYSGVRFHSNGGIFERDVFGGWVKFGEWLLTGANTLYHIHRTVDLGTLTTDAGDDLVMSTTRDYDKQLTSDGESPVHITFRISNVGDTVTYATRSYKFEPIRGLQ